MKDTKIILPVRGVDETHTESIQKEATTPDALNVRPTDGPSGRLRVSQRDGMAKHFDDAASGPIRGVRNLVYNSKGNTFEALEGELDSFGDGRGKLVEVEKAFSDSNRDVLNIQTDANGNLYLVANGSVEKRNTDLALLWTFALPLENSDFTLGPLEIGDDLKVYVAVDGGAPGSKGAAIYCLDQAPKPDSFDTDPVLLWQLQTDRWTRELKLHQSTLVALEQDDVAQEAWITTIVDIASATPEEGSSIPCPYPATCLAVKPDGSRITGHPYKLNRDKKVQHPGVGVGLVSWSPEDLDDWDARGWAWHMASSVTQVKHGKPVNFWGDSTGNGRNYLPGVPQNTSAEAPVPTYDEDGSLGVPALQFNGTQGLFSLPGGGKDSQRDACKSAVPNHGDGAFCTFIVCRPASQKETEEVDEGGVAIDYRRYLFQQRHNTRFEGAPANTWDVNDTGAYQSGILLNSGTSPSTGDDDLYCWGKSKSLRGSSEPGYARPYTSSSGKRTTSALADGSDDWSGMPSLKGAGDYGWPKEVLYDDPATDEEGEGITIFTFLHCGGLPEAIVVEGVVSGGGIIFTADDPFAFQAWGAGDSDLNNIQGTAYIDGVSDGTQAITSDDTASLSGTPSDGAATLSMVLDRNHMTRSCWRKNGVPVDRWEALPMAFRGVSQDTGSDDLNTHGNFEKNIELQFTALGLPAEHKNIKGYVGEIYEIVTVGRRQTNEDMVTLGGSDYHVWPTVLTHPLNAENQNGTSGEKDTPWNAIAQNIHSTEMEKFEGYLAHKYGVHRRLNSTGYIHPHYPLATGSWDIPIRTNAADSGQAWVVRQRSDAALLVKQDPKGAMAWCLVSSGATVSGNGDLVTHDIDGVYNSFGYTMARLTSGIALGIEDDIFIFGPGSGTNSEEWAIARIIDSTDDDSNPGLEAIGWWTLAGAGDATTKIGYQPDVTIRGKTDEFGGLHLPIVPGTLYLGAAAVDAIRAFNRDGTLRARLTTLQSGSVSYQNAHALALPPENPEYYT